MAFVLWMPSDWDDRRRQSFNFDGMRRAQTGEKAASLPAFIFFCLRYGHPLIPSCKGADS
jgi:hypothetical protein